MNSFILKKKINTFHILLQLWKLERKTFIIELQGLYNETPKKIKMKDVKLKRGIKTQTMEKRKEERTTQETDTRIKWINHGRNKFYSKYDY